MPLKLVRLLAVVLALLVPMQGMAAVAADLCMAFGHHQDAGMEHDAHAADGHDHATHSHDEAGSNAHAENTDGKAAHCGPCTACCASAGIAGAVGFSIPSSPASADYVFSQYPLLGVQPSGLFRPPLAL